MFEDFRQALSGSLRGLRLPMGHSIKNFGDEFRRDATHILQFLHDLAPAVGKDFNQTLLDYRAYVENQVQEQKIFADKPEYRFSTFAEVEGIVEGETFQKDNLFVLGFSYILSPYRYRLYRFVRESLNRYLEPGKRCLEIATGTGLDTYNAAQTGAQVESYDLNPYSSTCLNLLGVQDKVSFSSKFYNFEDVGVYDHCLMIELMEHLERPQEYLQSLSRILKPGGTACVSFAMRMPQIDHIYLFRHMNEPKKMLYEAGFEILEEDLLVSSFLGEKRSPGALHDEGVLPAVYVCNVSPAG